MLRRWRECVQLWLVLIPGSAASAEITGPASVPLQHTVRLGVTGVPAGANPKWSLAPLDGQDPAQVEWVSDPRGSAVRWIGPAGRWQVTARWAWLAEDKSVEFDEAAIVVVVGGAADGGLQAAYDRCPDRDPALLAKLVRLYADSAAAVRAQPLRDYAQLRDAMAEAAREAGVAGKLRPLQEAIQARMVGMGHPAAPGTTPVGDRARLAADLDSISVALSRIR